MWQSWGLEKDIHLFCKQVITETAKFDKVFLIGLGDVYKRQTVMTALSNILLRRMDIDATQ